MLDETALTPADSFMKFRQRPAGGATVTLIVNLPNIPAGSTVIELTAGKNDGRDDADLQSFLDASVANMKILLEAKGMGA